MEDMASAVRVVMEGEQRGLRLSTLHPSNDLKSRVWCPSLESNDPLGLGIPKIEEEGFIHLGCPVGSELFIQEALEGKIQKVKEVLARLPSL